MSLNVNRSTRSFRKKSKPHDVAISYYKSGSDPTGLVKAKINNLIGKNMRFYCFIISIFSSVMFFLPIFIDILYNYFLELFQFKM